jgi:hypothetical protein
VALEPIRRRAHSHLAQGEQTTRHTRPYRLAHWAYHLPASWLFSRSCGPTTTVVAAVWLAGLFVAVPYATPLLLANWAVPFIANGIRAAWYGKWSLLTRPQAHQIPCVATGPHDPAETPGCSHSHVPKWRSLVAERAERGGRIAGKVDRWLSRPSRLIELLGKITSAADSGNRKAKAVDDWINERSQVASFFMEAAILAIGLGLHASWGLVFPLEMLFHNIPDILSGYVGARTGTPHRVFRPGMFQRRTTVESLVVRGDLEAPDVPAPSVHEAVGRQQHTHSNPAPHQQRTSPSSRPLPTDTGVHLL